VTLAALVAVSSALAALVISLRVTVTVDMVEPSFSVSLDFFNARCYLATLAVYHKSRTVVLIVTLAAC